MLSRLNVLFSLNFHLTLITKSRAASIWDARKKNPLQLTEMNAEHVYRII